jgi:hypothetical protein
MPWWLEHALVLCGLATSLAATPVLVSRRVRWRWALLCGLTPGLCLTIAGIASLATAWGHRLPPGEEDWNNAGSVGLLGVVCGVAFVVSVGLALGVVVLAQWRVRRA